MKPTHTPNFNRALKSFLAPAIFVSLLCCAGPTAANAQVKVGVVDMNKVFSGYYKTKEAENKINDAREGAKRSWTSAWRATSRCSTRSTRSTRTSTTRR